MYISENNSVNISFKFGIHAVKYEHHGILLMLCIPDVRLEDPVMNCEPFLLYSSFHRRSTDTLR